MDTRKADSLATHASLLERLKDLEDQDSWQEFYRTYRKLIFNFALQHALTPTEAEEVVQETVITLARNLPKFQYDPQRCSFKTWLFNLTMWRIRDQIRKRHPQETSIDRKTSETGRTRAIEQIPEPEGERVTAMWDEEWQRDLLGRAMERLKARVDEKQFQIFDLYAMRQWPAREVARSLGVSVARVYLAKHRLGRSLARELGRLQREEELQLFLKSAT
ncbi:MAG TPA: sigma-70 family RNA polymerase sigma factor [Candidatus Paceibacterota bacterium]|nr:sigma-70 family RNA polymerase sigma factor [Verrucomicrobiota bacterium]HRZ43712.1 sigma-70 family RNA polymerase sigma factor [Candidatus Paceibacterota bacterium]HRZ99327.1 sigma-70 family RNA polymerase sigma factor [Candidatus Paceibacterota bacterium]